MDIDEFLLDMGYVGDFVDGVGVVEIFEFGIIVGVYLVVEVGEVVFGMLVFVVIGEVILCCWWGLFVLRVFVVCIGLELGGLGFVGVGCQYVDWCVVGEDCFG